MLKGCESFPDGCIIFLDELDALATSRSSGAAPCPPEQRAEQPGLAMQPAPCLCRSWAARRMRAQPAWPRVNTLPVAEMHEATRRVLGVLLRHLDGFDSTKKRTVVIGATNRKQVGRAGATSGTSACAAASCQAGAGTFGWKACPRRRLSAICGTKPFPALSGAQDLDPALISRFSTSVNFGLPSESSRWGAKGGLGSPTCGSEKACHASATTQRLRCSAPVAATMVPG